MPLSGVQFGNYALQAAQFAGQKSIYGELAQNFTNSYNKGELSPESRLPGVLGDNLYIWG